MIFLESIGMDWPHVCPVNEWVEDRKGSYFYYSNDRKYFIDKTTNEKYLNDTKKQTCAKFALITFGGTFYHIVALVVATIYRIFRVLSLYAFWKQAEEQDDSLKSRLIEWLVDGTRILIAPLGLVCLFLTAVCGLIHPSRDARKMHSRMEIIFYGHPLLALCMHPQPFKPSNDSMRRSQVLITNSLVISPLMMIALLAYRIVRFCSFYAFWKQYICQESESLKECYIDWLKDGKRTLLTPCGTIGSFAGAIYSVIDGDKGEELCVQAEETFFGVATSMFIPPKLREHLFGGERW